MTDRDIGDDRIGKSRDAFNSSQRAETDTAFALFLARTGYPGA
jgi:hypothetical protein